MSRQVNLKKYILLGTCMRLVVVSFIFILLTGCSVIGTDKCRSGNLEDEEYLAICHKKS